MSVQSQPRTFGASSINRGSSGIKAPVRTVTPVRWLAAVGGGFLSLQIYVLVRWIASGQATPTPTGRDHVPWWSQAAARTLDIAAPIAALIVIWFFLVRPMRRAGRLTLDGMLIIAWLSMYFLQDGWLNYTQAWFLYSSAHINFGSWYSQVPGWLSPNGHLLPEPVLFWGGTWIAAGFGFTVLVCKLMRRFKARYPSTGTLGMIAVAFAAMVVIDLAFELPLLRLQLYSYAGGIRSVSLFAGTTYQFPIYCNLLWAAVWTGMTCVRYFVDDRGLSVAERGVERLKPARGKHQLLRLLAVIGTAHLIILFAYNVPMQWFATHADRFPTHTPSYLVNGMCGGNSGGPCPGPHQPIPRDR
jgi:Spirocyclase AveC-like